MTETLANRYSYESTKRELSNEYQHDRVSMVLKDFFIFPQWMKVASVLEGLSLKFVFIWYQSIQSNKNWNYFKKKK